MTSFKTSRSGHPYIISNGISLNSSYDPEKEAKRFIDVHITEVPGTVVIIGGTLGYLVSEIRRRFPETRILCYFFESSIYEICKTRLPESMPKSCLMDRPDPGISDEFLGKNLHELDLEGLTILEWTPACRAFPENADISRRTLSQRVRELNGSVVSLRTFGRRGIKNSFRNFLNISRFRRPVGPFPPILIAASGPSLVDSITYIRRNRNRLFVLALSSSLDTLLSGGIVPDAVVSTDSGYWASVLLRPVRDTMPTLFLPLPAYTDHHTVSSAPVVIINQGTFYERELLEGAGIPFMAIPPEGTVTATAIRLGLALTDGPVLVAGFDLSYRDIQAHCRPHAFDIFDNMVQNRTMTQLGNIASRVFDSTTVSADGFSRTSLPLRTYAGWFSRHFAAYRFRLFRLNPSVVHIPGMRIHNTDTDIPETACGIIPSVSDHVLFSDVETDRNSRRVHAGNVLEKWIDNLSAAGKPGTDMLEELFRHPWITEFCYTLAIEDLFEIIRFRRRGEYEKIAPAVRSMLSGAASFIKELEIYHGTW